MYEDLTIQLLDAMTADQLVAIIESPDERSQSRAAARMALVKRFPCHDCGARPGRECLPDYGCQNSSRREWLRVRFDGEDVWADVQTTNDGAYRVEANDNGGYDVYVVATGEKIVDDTTSWHFDVVGGIERHLNKTVAQREP